VRSALTQEMPKGEYISGDCARIKPYVKIGTKCPPSLTRENVVIDTCNTVRIFLVRRWTFWSSSTTENCNVSYKDVREAQLLSR